MAAGSSQPGPTESGSGKAQYTPAAASIATNAGHRGSRVIGLVMAMWQSTRVEFNTVSLGLKRMGHYRFPDAAGVNANEGRGALLRPLCRSRILGNAESRRNPQPAPETHRKEVLLCPP